jgi:phosphoglycolate phosphatase
VKNFKSLKLIIFDLDGTLVDSSIDITNALNHALEPYGVVGAYCNTPLLAVEDTIKMVGEGLTRLVEKILGEENAKIKDDVLERFINYYSNHLTDYTRPYPGIKETLERLVGYKKAVISNKRESMSKNLLAQLGLLNFFDIVLGSDSVTERKPSPVPIKKVLETLNIMPEDAIIIGDSNFDIQAGKSAGITTIAVTYGYRDRDILKDADFMIDKIDQLFQIIGDRMGEVF